MPIINQIVKGGGITPTGTLSITQNGVYNVANYANADVSVSGGGSGTPQPNIKMQISNGLLFADGSELIDLTGVNTVNDYALCRAYSGSTITPTVSFTSPLKINQFGAQYMFYQCHFADPDVDISGITEVGYYGCDYMFANSDVESADISGIETLGQYSVSHMFYNCSYLTSVTTMSATVAGGYSCVQMFYGCSSLPLLDLSNFEIVSGYQPMQQMCQGCTALTSIDVSYIREVSGTGALSSMLRDCSALPSMSWDSLRSISSFGSSTSSYVYRGCTGLLAIHFPQNMQPIIEALQGYGDKWGASNATIYFDLPSSYELTGADGNTYYRNPKYDTVTALSWFDVNVGRTTPYYTPQSLGDPVVGATIYSDSDCTIPVTTIDSIA